MFLRYLQGRSPGYHPTVRPKANGLLAFKTEGIDEFNSTVHVTDEIVHISRAIKVSPDGNYLGPMHKRLCNLAHSNFPGREKNHGWYPRFRCIDRKAC
jgi:hypothetical protein